MKEILRGGIRALGFDVVRYRSHSVGVDPSAGPPDLSHEDRVILEQVAPYTMTSVERQMALVSATRYLVRQNIPGCVVECGVWRGGSSMAVAYTLRQENAADRNLYLYDTFNGMTSPTDVDMTTDGTLAQTHLDNDVDKTLTWCVAGIEDVQRNMEATGYPQTRVHLIKGPVESTIPERSPAEGIALLRLDTDWYESTRHELIHLFPRLVDGGILIIDDYGHWTGARKAVDEYLANWRSPYYLHRIDYTGRLLIKR